MGFDVYSWIIIPLLIFFARITDVSLGTLRFIFIAKGYKKLAPLLGFFEVLIWVLAVREVMMNLRNIACLLAYGLGFATGNYIGMWLEEKLSIGMVLVRTVLKTDALPLMDFMKTNDYGYTLVDGQGTQGEVKILFSIIQRKNLPRVLDAISTHNPNAFYTVENIKEARQGVFPAVEGKTVFSRLFRQHRKSK